MLKIFSKFSDHGRNLLSKYRQFTKTTSVYDKDHTLEYLSLGLVSEAGEVAGAVKRVFRGDKKKYSGIDQIHPEDKEKIFKEMGDVLWYLTALADQLGTTVDALIENNMDKLTDRKKRDVLKGNGDDR